jgi:hypothetical protein
MNKEEIKKVLGWRNEPGIQIMNGVMPIGMKNPKQMCKDCFPNAKLKFMQEVGSDKSIKIELELIKAF